MLKIVLLPIFLWYFNYSGFFDEQKVKKYIFLKNLFEIEIFCNIINIFTDTFDQFNAFLLNKY